MAIGIGLLALVALTADGDLSSAAIVLGAVGLNALIVGPYFLLRANAERLRRLLPPWLPWWSTALAEVGSWLGRSGE